MAEVGRHVFLCFIGFDPEQPIDVVLTLPDGSQESTVFGTKPGLNEDMGIDPFVGPVSVDALGCGPAAQNLYPDDVCEFTWLIRPDYQAGRYTIEARQGITIANGAFDLVDSSEPWLESARPWQPATQEGQIVTPGDRVSFVISGFEAGQLVPLAFYNEISTDSFELHTDAGTVQVDDRGLAIVEADSSVFAPGFYCLATPLMEFPNCHYGAGFRVG